MIRQSDNESDDICRSHDQDGNISRIHCCSMQLTDDDDDDGVDGDKDGDDDDEHDDDDDDDELARWVDARAGCRPGGTCVPLLAPITPHCLHCTIITHCLNCTIITHCLHCMVFPLKNYNTAIHCKVLQCRIITLQYTELHGTI